MSRTSGQWLWFFIATLYLIGTSCTYNILHIKNLWIYYFGGALIVWFATRSAASYMDLFISIVIPLLFKSHVSSYIIFYLFLMVCIILIAAYRIKSKLVPLIMILSLAPWFYFYFKSSWQTLRIMDYIILSFILMTILKYLIDVYSWPKQPPEKIDIILCSYSSNTAHYTHRFIDGIKETGKEIFIHRHHYTDDPPPSLKGDALVIAFPVYGWKPPWTMIEYLMKNLPRGKGKPAFILYTSAGGPENAGVIAWILLKLKGYSVIGRNWAAYPMNVVTFRWFSKKLWNTIDKSLPSTNDVNEIIKTGCEFAEGLRTGLPMLFFPFPLAIFGLLLENKYINRYIYKTYTWKKRCRKCYLCVNYCPTNRFRIVDGIPKSDGDCALCLSCINLCPAGAMQMIALSEYGIPYKPRWPELLIKPRKQAKKA